jgi:predicted Zn-dependent peptidase
VNGLRLFAPLMLWAILGSAQDLKDFEKKVTEFTLPNGLHFIVVERHEAPVVAFHTYVNSGSANDPSGQTGVANMVARMALKGTAAVGSRDWAAEKKALETLEEAYLRQEAERRKGARANTPALISAETQFSQAAEKAEALVDRGAFQRIITENGGVDLNVRTQRDSTDFAYSLPSNRLELWFSLESQRLSHPVLREFYYERNAVAAEYQSNVEAKELPRLEEVLLATAFEAHPYRNPVTGWLGDISHLGTAQAQAFLETCYVPGNIVIAIVGDVDPAEARRLADRYFGPMPPRPLPPLAHPDEPRQVGQKIAEVASAAQGMVLVGYKRPEQNHPDDIVLDVLQSILSGGGEGGLLQSVLVEPGIAQSTTAVATFPGGRYPSLFLFMATVQKGHTIEECRKGIEGAVNYLGSKPVDAATLARAKARLRADATRRLAGNADLAALLPAYYAGYGDWRALFTGLDRLDKVTAVEVQKAALRYFIPTARTVVYTPQAGRPEPAQGQAGGAQ